MRGSFIGRPRGGLSTTAVSASAQFDAAGVGAASGVGEATFAGVFASAGIAASDFRFEISASSSGAAAGAFVGQGVILRTAAFSAAGVASSVFWITSQTVTDTVTFLQKPIDFILAERAARDGRQRLQNPGTGEIKGSVLRNIFGE